MTMNIGQIRKAVAGYLQVPESELYRGVDLLLMALNNARKTAERNHDWDCQRVIVISTATNGVGSLNGNKLLGVTPDEFVNIKTAETFYLKQGDALLPVKHSSRLHAANKARERFDRRSIDYTGRYAKSIDLQMVTNYNGNLRLPNQVLLHGSQYTMEPAPEGSVDLAIDCYRWLEDYTANDDTDFFVEHGSDYLMWSAIVELNYLVQAFIPQTEGNLSPPEKMRDGAYASLLEHDNFIQETGRFPTFR